MRMIWVTPAPFHRRKVTYIHTYAPILILFVKQMTVSRMLLQENLSNSFELWWCRLVSCISRTGTQARWHTGILVHIVQVLIILPPPTASASCPSLSIPTTPAWLQSCLMISLTNSSRDSQGRWLTRPSENRSMAVQRRIADLQWSLEITTTTTTTIAWNCHLTHQAACQPRRSKTTARAACAR